MSRIDTVQWGADRLRVRPWRGDPQIAHVSPAPGHPPSARAVDDCVRALTAQGFASVLTAALSPVEQRVFLEHEFVVHEHLHLLRRSLASPVAAPSRPTRRARRRDRPAVLEVDRLAFNPFWRFDAAGLDDARAATPSSRFRVVDEGEIDGYAITGRAGLLSYLQRLAVRPDRQRMGIGSTLVLDALSWAHRRGATSMLVNTQEQNGSAVALYERLGFVLEPTGLDVLELPLGGHGPTA
jgi:ribosomal protein S18 acetylase RimI-like enzyme